MLIQHIRVFHAKLTLFFNGTWRHKEVSIPVLSELLGSFWKGHQQSAGNRQGVIRGVRYRVFISVCRLKVTVDRRCSGISGD